MRYDKSKEKLVISVLYMNFIINRKLNLTDQQINIFEKHYIFINKKA